MIIEKNKDGTEIVMIMSDSNTLEMVIRLKREKALELKDMLVIALARFCRDCHYFRSKFVTQGKTCYKKGIDADGSDIACDDEFKAIQKSDIGDFKNEYVRHI